MRADGSGQKSVDSPADRFSDRKSELMTEEMFAGSGLTRLELRDGLSQLTVTALQVQTDVFPLNLFTLSLMALVSKLMCLVLCDSR